MKHGLKCSARKKMSVVWLNYFQKYQNKKKSYLKYQCTGYYPRICGAVQRHLNNCKSHENSVEWLLSSTELLYTLLVGTIIFEVKHYNNWNSLIKKKATKQED